MRSTIRFLLAATVPMFIGAARMPTSYANREFGFTLNPNAQGEFYTLFIYSVLNGEVVESRPIRTESFILQMAGFEESPANIEGIDLFEEYGIRDCGPRLVQGAVRSGLECLPIRNLWKLRYRDALVAGQGLGWSAEESVPSPRQQIMLQAYRSSMHPHWQGPYIGKDALRLLRDMQDPEWVRLYKMGG